MATVNSLALDLIQEMEESTDDTGFVAKVEARINEALDEIAVATNWQDFKTRSTFPTVATQAQYNLPAGAREIIQLQYVADGQPLIMGTIQEAARRNILLTDPGKARVWLDDGRVVVGSDVLMRIRLYPVPSEILSIEAEYYYHPSDVASGSVLPVQDQFIVLVKQRTRAKLLINDQKYDAADREQRSYESNLAVMVKRTQSNVSAKVVLRQTDLGNIRRRERPILDPQHYNNGFGW